jgi:hypothetical protein
VKNLYEMVEEDIRRRANKEISGAGDPWTDDDVEEFVERRLEDLAEKLVKLAFGELC